MDDGLVDEKSKAGWSGNRNYFKKINFIRRLWGEKRRQMGQKYPD